MLDTRRASVPLCRLTARGMRGPRGRVPGPEGLRGAPAPAAAPVPARRGQVSGRLRLLQREPGPQGVTGWENDFMFLPGSSRLAPHGPVSQSRRAQTGRAHTPVFSARIFPGRE